MTKHIYVDIDDVLSKTTDTYTQVVEREFGKKVAFSALKTFDLKASFDLTEAEFDYFFSLVHRPEALMDYGVVEGCVKTLSHWAEAGHHIDIVTGRPSATREVSLAWLDHNQIPHASFTMVDKYNRPDNDPRVTISKEEFKNRSYDLAVEDSRDMALYLAGEMGVSVNLYHRPWNQTPLDNDRVRRVFSWDEIRGTRL